MTKRWRALAAVLAASFGSLAVAQDVPLLAQVRAGLWQVHEVDSKEPARAVCVTDPHRLLQLEHGVAACTFRTVASAGQTATVRYVCPGAGNGTTDLTVESRDILRLHTQGVARGAPFDTVYEARFGGACRGGLAAR
jgi:hypothetical protein